MVILILTSGSSRFHSFAAAMGLLLKAPTPMFCITRGDGIPQRYYERPWGVRSYNHKYVRWNICDCVAFINPMVIGVEISMPTKIKKSFTKFLVKELGKQFISTLRRIIVDRLFPLRLDSNQKTPQFWIDAKGVWIL